MIPMIPCCCFRVVCGSEAREVYNELRKDADAVKCGCFIKTSPWVDDCTLKGIREKNALEAAFNGNVRKFKKALKPTRWFSISFWYSLQFPLQSYALYPDPNTLIYFSSNPLRNRFSLLHLASLRKQTAIVDCILHHKEWKTTINEKNALGQSALHLAALLVDSYSLVFKLLKGGANNSLVDEDGRTPLDYAVIVGNKPVVDLMLSYENLQKKYFVKLELNSIFHWKQMNVTEIIYNYWNEGGIVNLKGSPNAFTPLDRAIIRIVTVKKGKDELAILQTLIRYGAIATRETLKLIENYRYILQKDDYAEVVAYATTNRMMMSPDPNH